MMKNNNTLFTLSVYFFCVVYNSFLLYESSRKKVRTHWTAKGSRLEGLWFVQYFVVLAEKKHRMGKMNKFLICIQLCWHQTYSVEDQPSAARDFVLVLVKATPRLDHMMHRKLIVSRISKNDPGAKSLFSLQKKKVHKILARSTSIASLLIVMRCLVWSK